MEFRTRERAMLGHDENVFQMKGKALEQKGLQNGAPKRAVLGDLGNVAPQPHQLKGKPQINDWDKKPAALRPITRSYKNVTAKVDTGHSLKMPAVNLKLNQEKVKIVPRDDNLTRTTKTNSLTSQLRQTKISSIPALKTSRENSIAREEAKPSVRKTEAVKIERYPSLRKYSEIKEPVVPTLKIKQEAYSTELLEGVEDIDSGEKNSPLLMGIYIKDIYNYLMHIETEYPIKKNHLENQITMTPKMRAMLIDWLVEVHEQFSLMLETLHLTVAIIDRYLQVVNTVQRKHIQLVGITAMFIACKYEEMLIPDLRDFVYITDNSYTKSEILKCERAILNELGFCLGRPLPVHFERRFIKAARSNAKTHHLAKYLIDLSLVEYNMAHYRPSEIAAAAVCLSISVLSPNTVPRKCWTPTLVHYSGYKYDSISPIVKMLAAVAMAQGTTRFKAVMNKYNSSKHGKVPSFPELRGNLIKSIACESPKS